MCGSPLYVRRVFTLGCLRSGGQRPLPRSAPAPESARIAFPFRVKRQTIPEFLVKRIHLIAVGRLKTPCWRDAAAYYAKRLARRLTFQESLVKDADARLEPAMRKRQEAERLLKMAQKGEFLICLDENGESRTSEQFAGWLRGLFERGQTPCFVVGGAYGLDRSILGAADFCLSLGAMTFPHELARVLLLEQVYRAENIAAGSGYHH